MLQVKIFIKFDYEELENQVNRWIKEHSFYSIKDIKWNGSSPNKAMILYDKTESNIK